MSHTVTRPLQASSSCIPCHIFFYWTRLNISYRNIYDVVFKVFFYANNGWILQKNLIYAAYLRFLNNMSKRVLGVILVFSTSYLEKNCDIHLWNFSQFKIVFPHYINPYYAKSRYIGFFTRTVECQEPIYRLWRNLCIL